MKTKQKPKQVTRQGVLPAHHPEGAAERVEDGAAAEVEIVANGHAKGQIINGALKSEGMALLKHNGKYFSLFPVGFSFRLQKLTIHCQLGFC